MERNDVKIIKKEFSFRKILFLFWMFLQADQVSCITLYYICSFFMGFM